MPPSLPGGIPPPSLSAGALIAFPGQLPGQHNAAVAASVAASVATQKEERNEEEQVRLDDETRQAELSPHVLISFCDLISFDVTDLVP